MPIQKELNLPRGDQHERIAKAMESIAQTMKENQAELGDDAHIALFLDGTKAKYASVMKAWFAIHGAGKATPKELTALVDQWYTITRPDWDGYVEFAQPEVTAVSTGTKGGDNALMTCTPSTDETANTDDYAGNPLFAVVDCNWVIDPETLEPVITAIDGITGNFERYNPERYVGVLQMSGYVWIEELQNSYRYGYSAKRTQHQKINPLPESVRHVDNTVRPWVVHSKYMSKLENGKLTCYAGVIPTAFTVSHNTLVGYGKATGTGYSGGCVTDNAFLQLMFFIKYANLSADGILQGACSNDATRYAALGENNTNRILMTAGQQTAFVKGMGVLIGTYTDARKADRAYCNDLSGKEGRIVTDVATVTIEDVEYGVVCFDGAPINTVANGATTEGTTAIETFHYMTGFCDTVKGNDGAPINPGSGKYPAKLQGIEYAVGAYEVYADVILNLYKVTAEVEGESDKYYHEPHVVRTAALQATSLTADHERTGLAIQQPAAAGWNYIKKLQYGNGIFFPAMVGGSSSTYLRDGFYQEANVVSTREWLAFGHLFIGAGYAGLAGLHGSSLGNAFWLFAARLSPNGNRGEFTA